VGVRTRQEAVAHDGHVVRFYEHDAELVEAVCPYLAEALSTDEAAIVIATDAHRQAFEVELEACGVDLERARADGLLVSLDAETTLTAFSDGGRIDHDAFHAVLGTLIRDVSSSGRPVRAYGEMVALLWDRGDVLAAIELETLWNQLGRELSFSLLCSYASASVARSEHADALERVRRAHSAVLESQPHARERHERTDVDAPTGASATFPPDPDSPGRARRMAAATLRRWGHDERLVDDVSLVVSELASNAVRHAGSEFSLALQMQGPLLRVTVEDRAPLPAATADGGLTPQPPHGLRVVDSLAVSWGVEPTHGGKRVWAQLMCAPPPG